MGPARRRPRIARCPPPNWKIGYLAHLLGAKSGTGWRQQVGAKNYRSAGGGANPVERSIQSQVADPVSHQVRSVPVRRQNLLRPRSQRK